MSPGPLVSVIIAYYKQEEDCIAEDGAERPAADLPTF